MPVNADSAGFVAGLKTHKVAIAGRSIWLVGAGTAIAWSLAEEGPHHMAITDAGVAAAENLADGPRAAYPAITVTTRMPAPHELDIAVDATPSGLHVGDPLSFDPAPLRKDATVVEIIMKPATTDLLRTAAALGLKTVPGQAMLDDQLQIYADYLRLTPAIARSNGCTPALAAAHM